MFNGFPRDLCRMWKHALGGFSWVVESVSNKSWHTVFLNPCSVPWCLIVKDCSPGPLVVESIPEPFNRYSALISFLIQVLIADCYPCLPANLLRRPPPPWPRKLIIGEAGYGKLFLICRINRIAERIRPVRMETILKQIFFHSGSHPQLGKVLLYKHTHTHSTYYYRTLLTSSAPPSKFCCEVVPGKGNRIQPSRNIRFRNCPKSFAKEIDLIIIISIILMVFFRVKLAPELKQFPGRLLLI